MLAEILVKVAGMEKQKQQKYRPRPSSSGPERCVRQMTYHSRGFKADKEMADRFVMTIDDSIFHEDITHDWISKTAFKIHSTQMKVESLELPSGEKLGGSIDGVITDLLGVDRLYEHKAINHFTFNKYWGGDYPLDYFCQCCLYIKGLRKVNPDIKEAVLLIKNKNTAQYIDYLIHYDEAIDTAYIVEVCHSNGEKKTPKKDEVYLEVFHNVIEKVVAKFEAVRKHTIQKTLPDRPHEIGTTFPCGYCNWEETCFEGYEDEFNNLTDNAELDEEFATSFKYYKELQMHEKESKNAVDELKEKIKKDLKELDCRKGKCGEYTFNLRLQKKEGIDKEKIPLNIIKQALKTSYFEVLDIRLKSKKKGEKK